MNQETATFYNRYHRFYPLIDFFLKPHKKELLQRVNALPGGQLLEVGVGNGSLLPGYRRHVLTAIDISARMLETASGRKTSVPVTTAVMDGEALQFPDARFDYVVINHVLSVTAQPERMIHEAFRVLKQGGLLFIQNHFTPGNWLRFADMLAAPFSKRLRLRSLFRVQDIPALQQFQLRESVTLGLLGYYKLLTYSK